MEVWCKAFPPRRREEDVLEMREDKLNEPGRENVSRKREERCRPAFRREVMPLPAEHNKDSDAMGNHRYVEVLESGVRVVQNLKGRPGEIAVWRRRT